jgi:hypothetical protein
LNEIVRPFSLTCALCVETLMKPKDIFGLAVRLLGLYFLYLGLNSLTQLLGSDIVESPDKTDVENGLLPVAFDFAVAWWLLAGKSLIRMAYPDGPKIPESLPGPPRQPGPSPEPAPASTLTDMDRAEKKLAALVEKPRPD